MTATSPAAPPYQEPTARSVPGRAGFGNLLASEWTKIRSVRSTVWSLILLIVLTIGFTALFTWPVGAAYGIGGAPYMAAVGGGGPPRSGAP